MSHDFDDELERSTERRSRRNPRMRDTAAYGSSGQEGGYASERERWESRQRKRQEAAERELDVMGDSRIHAIPKQPKRESSQEPVSRSYAPDMLDEMEMGRGRGTSRPQRQRSTCRSGAGEYRKQSLRFRYTQQCSAGNRRQPCGTEGSSRKNDRRKRPARRPF